MLLVRYIIWNCERLPAYFCQAHCLKGKVHDFLVFYSLHSWWHFMPLKRQTQRSTSGRRKKKKTRQIREKIWSDDICKCSSQGVGIYVFLMFMTNFMHFITYPLTIYYSSETIFVQTLVSSWWFLDDIMKAAGHLRL